MTTLQQTEKPARKRRPIYRLFFEDVAVAIAAINPAAKGSDAVLASMLDSAKYLLRSKTAGSSGTLGYCIHVFREPDATTLLATVSPYMARVAAGLPITHIDCRAPFFPKKGA